MHPGIKSLKVTFLMVTFSLTFGLCPSYNLDADAPLWEKSVSGLPADGTYFGVVFGNINNDGKMDFVASSDGKGIRVFLGNGMGSWNETSPPPASGGGYGDVALGDYDSDGNVDIFAGSPGNSYSSPTGLHVFKGDGLGGFTELDTGTTELPTDGKWRGVATGDVNKDGHLDLAAAAGYGTTEGIHVFLGDGAGRFRDNSSGLPASEDRGSAVVLADFNSDGTLDVAAGGNPGVSVFLGNIGFTREMTWADSSTGLPSQRFTGVSFSDVNSDGLMDLLLASYNAGSGVGLRVFRNNNNAASWTSISTNLPKTGDFLDISGGDFDDDGNPDLVSGGVYGTKGIRLFLGDGNGTWTEELDGLPQTGERVGCDVGDFNSDGYPDLVFGMYSNKGLEVYKNIPASSASPGILFTSPASGAEAVPLNAEITFTFNIQMNTTATEQAVSSNPAISWSAAWTASDSAVTFSPSQNLNGQTMYTISVSTEAESANGMNLNSSYGFSFTTGSFIDSTPPFIVGTSPADNAQEVKVSSKITITFSEPMDSSILQTAIVISPSSEATSSWDAQGKVLSMFPKLEVKTTYTVMVSSDVSDTAGNLMGSDYSFSFTTGAGKDSAGDKTPLYIGITSFLILIAAVLIILAFHLISKKKR